MLTIKAEGYAGQSIFDVAKDMVELARKLDVCVEANLNGFVVSALPTDTTERVVMFYDRELRRNRSADANR